jgi:hypothetical protein
MKNNLIVEGIISVLLIGVLIFFINPVDLLMPPMMHPFMVPVLVTLFIIFTALLWKEKPGDEREQQHKFIASRFAYFAGAVVLIVGIIYQSIHHSIDPWIIIAISVILLAKFIGLIYEYIKH